MTQRTENKPKALCIAEKPSLERAIKEAYNQIADELEYDITVISQVGHLVELLNPVELNPVYKDWSIDLLPINPDNEGGWKYKVNRKTKEVYQRIENEVKSGKYSVIIHAGDPDQEGELLVRLVLAQIGNTLPVLRLLANTYATPTIQHALRNLVSDNESWLENLYHAALLRQHTDWLFGMNGSRAIAGRIYAGKDNKIASGRVMTWVQTIIVDREDEIENFVPKTTYGIRIKYDNGMAGDLYEGAADSDDESANTGIVFYDTKEEALNIISKLADKGVIQSFTKNKIVSYAPKLYKLATIQIDCSKIGFSASKTLEIIQSLYEKKYVSYPRTDCEVISLDEDIDSIISATSEIFEFVEAARLAKSKAGEIKKNTKYVNDKELKKHGHSALIPTSVVPDFNSMSNEEITVYKMIAKRFLCIFQPPLIQQKIVALVSVSDRIFRTSGKCIIDPGYTNFLGNNITDIRIPDLSEGEALAVNTKEITERTTTCPKRFTNGTLIAAMENPAKYLTDKTIKEAVDDLHIGTPATRSVIIDKLVEDKYIEIEKGYYKPTKFGSFMIHTIRGISLCQIDTTGNWEQLLMKVRQGEETYENAQNYMSEQVNILINEIKNINKVSFVEGGVWERKVLMECPACKKLGVENNIIIGNINYYCSGYKSHGCKCGMQKTLLKATFSDDDVKNLMSGGSVTKKLTKDDKSWEQKLRFSPEEGKLIFDSNIVETDIKCPDCGDKMKKSGKKIFCDCGAVIWTSLLGNNPDDVIKSIIEKGSTDNKIKLVKKDGSFFEAKVRLKKDSGKTIGIEPFWK